MFSLQDLIFSVSLAVYIAISVTVAAIRWGHKCEPYAKYPDYYYPAWKVFVFCFLTNLVLLPVVFFPSRPDAILLLRLLLIMASPILCALVAFSYFGKVLKVDWWRKPVYALSFSYFIMAFTALVLEIVPGTQLGGLFGRCFFAVGGTLALLYLACLFMAVRMVAKALRRVAEENYSNQEDFPRSLARGFITINLLHLTTSWVCTTIGTKSALSICMLILSALAVALLIGILPPHRAMTIEELEAGRVQAQEEPEFTPPETTQEEDEADEILSPQRKKQIARAIRKYVEEEQAYLDSHLTLASLSRSIGFNRSYVSAVMSEQLGGFFNYVNRCRLAHAAQLKVEQPDIAVGDLIAASGFGSRQSYYNVRRKLDE